MGPSGRIGFHRCGSRQRGLREEFSTWFLESVEGHVRSPACQNVIYIHVFVNESIHLHVGERFRAEESGLQERKKQYIRIIFCTAS